MNIVFRIYPEGDVIALFCNSAKDCNHGNVMSYQHVGQHGETSQQLGRHLRLATPDQYAPLKRELERVYSCEIKPVSRLVA
jgi:hypothetical protein